MDLAVHETSPRVKVVSILSAALGSRGFGIYVRPVGGYRVLSRIRFSIRSRDRWKRSGIEKKAQKYFWLCMPLDPQPSKRHLMVHTALATTWELP